MPVGSFHKRTLRKGKLVDDVLTRDKTSLGNLWIEVKSLTDLDNLPDPDVLAEEIIDNTESGLGNLQQILNNPNHTPEN